jgi:hypothetical protein
MPDERPQGGKMVFRNILAAAFCLASVISTVSVAEQTSNVVGSTSTLTEGFYISAGGYGFQKFIRITTVGNEVRAILLIWSYKQKREELQLAGASYSSIHIPGYGDVFKSPVFPSEIELLSEEPEYEEGQYASPNFDGTSRRYQQMVKSGSVMSARMINGQPYFVISLTNGQEAVMGPLNKVSKEEFISGLKSYIASRDVYIKMNFKQTDSVADVITQGNKLCTAFIGADCSATGKTLYATPQGLLLK